MLLDVERDLERTIFEKTVMHPAPWGSARGDASLRRHWLTYEQRRVQLPDPRSATQPECYSARSRKAANGPVSTMAERIAADAQDWMRGPRYQSRPHRVHPSSVPRGCDAEASRGGFKHKPQLFLDRVFELTATRAFVRVSLHTAESRESRP